MARKNSDDLLMEDDLAAAFIDDNELMTPNGEDTAAEELPQEEVGEPVDVYETADKLVVKARTAGISKSDLDVSISDNILTISGVLSAGEEEQTTRWHIQECYWGEFSRTIALPVPVREDDDSVKAELKDGVLTITFIKEKSDARKVINIE